MVLRLAALFLAVIGVSMIAGYLQGLRRHHYVLLVGVTLLALAGALVVPMPWARWGLIGLAVLAFIIALGLAVAETRRALEDIERERQGKQAEMEAYLEQFKRRYQDKLEREQAERERQQQEQASDNPQEQPPES